MLYLQHIDSNLKYRNISKVGIIKIEFTTVFHKCTKMLNLKKKTPVICQNFSFQWDNERFRTQEHRGWLESGLFRI